MCVPRLYCILYRVLVCIVNVVVLSCDCSIVVGGRADHKQRACMLSVVVNGGEGRGGGG